MNVTMTEKILGSISTTVTGSYIPPVKPASETPTHNNVILLNMDDVILTPEQVSEWLSLSLDDVNSLIRGGQIPSIYIKKNLYRISRNKVLEWLETNSRNTKSETNETER